MVMATRAEVKNLSLLLLLSSCLRGHSSFLLFKWVSIATSGTLNPGIR